MNTDWGETGRKVILSMRLYDSSQLRTFTMEVTILQGDNQKKKKKKHIEKIKYLN